MAGGQRPGRKALLGVCLGTLLVSTFAALPAAFAAVTFYPQAWWALAVIFPAFAAAAWWVWRDHSRAEAAEAAEAETEVLRLDEIADFQPAPPSRRPVGVRRWRRACGRAVQRIKEGVS